MAVIVSEEVLAGLEEVRDSGEINMFDRNGAIELAYSFGYDETAAWIHENKHQYAEGIFNGFESG